jgi:hypothetical protein
MDPTELNESFCLPTVEKNSPLGSWNCSPLKPAFLKKRRSTGVLFATELTLSLTACPLLNRSPLKLSILKSLTIDVPPGPVGWPGAHWIGLARR